MKLLAGTQADLSASDHLIGRLAQLAAPDREWILAHLSPGAKANLLRHLGQSNATAPAAASQHPDDEHVLDTVEADVVARYLAGEPSWAIALILSLRQWRWEQPVLTQLEPAARLEVNQLRHSLQPPSVPMRALVTRTLREQLTISTPGPRFEDLLDQAGDRTP